MFEYPTRYQGLELMDAPDVPKKELEATFSDINLVNRLLGGFKSTLQVLDTIFKRNKKESYTILDVGCGDGEMLRHVVKWARDSGIQLKCYGVDLNPISLDIAREKSRSYPEITYLNLNVNDWDIKNMPVDIVLCTLTLHHIEDELHKHFLNKLQELSRIAIIINDLERSRFAYVLFGWFSTIFMKTKMAKHDGKVSIRRGFVKKDLLKLAESLPEANHTISWQWAFRYIWVIRPKRNVYDL
ncbi:methyltransferase domain-containing protein [Cytophaga sp. FL35]|uniref:methyltransferase domain-containing protein n=1 Tax=Cytophaga sp. FL35 TaxID=1904456 RepID=UPI0016537C3E|nr:methyltransferase domain-containing protein [Cytophaga sp. FL35]MBC6998370.1 methyltransferase domain-containing protein [Cytophaga sp. FL35]